MGDRQIHPLNRRPKPPHSAVAADFDPRGVEVPAKAELAGPPERVANKHRRPFALTHITSPNQYNRDGLLERV
jgi:hypothetical protein